MLPVVIITVLTLVITCVLTVSCGRKVAAYPPPAQRSLELGPDPGGVGAFVNMGDPLANDYLVQDIGREPDVRRWAFSKPELRFRVSASGNLRFTAEFTIPEITFKATGPVTVSCAVNGKFLGGLCCDHAGDFRLDLPVPKGLVEPEKIVRVTFEANPRWVSPEDGAQLSFLLRSAGFTQ